MPDIGIKIKITKDGAEAIDATGFQLESLGKSGKNLASDLTGIPVATVGAIAGIAALGAAALDQASKLNEIGVTSLRAKAGLEAMSNSHADEFLNRMIASTQGLVDDTFLMQNATQALSAGAVTTSSQLAQLSRDGAILGLTFRSNAQEGITSLTRALETVGNTRALKQVGLDATEVKNRYDELKATMSNSDAWGMAVMEAAGTRADKLSGILTSTGTAAERVGIAFENWKEGIGEGIAVQVEGIARAVEKVNAALTITVALNPSGKSAAPAGGREGLMRGVAGGGGSGGGASFGGDAALPYGPIAFGNQSNPMAPDLVSSMPYNINDRRGMSEGTRTNSELSARQSMQGVVAVQNEAKAAQAGLNGLWQAGSTYLHQQAAAAQGLLQPMAEASKIAQADAQRRQGIQSVGAAFGAKQDGLFGELNTLTEDAGIANKGKGKKGGAISEADQKVIDNYAIATGAATAESLKFGKMQTDIRKAAQEGTITLAQEAASLLEMGRAAKDGATNMENLNRIETKNKIDRRGILSGKVDASDIVDMLKGQKKGEGSKAVDVNDPYAGPQKSAEKATEKISAMQNAGATAAQAFVQNASVMASGLENLVMPAAAKTAGALSVIPGLIKGMIGTITVNVGFQGSGGGGRSAGYR